MLLQIWDTGLGGDSDGGHYHDPRYTPKDNPTGPSDEHYLAPPNNSNIDQYSVPQQHDVINNSTPHPVAVGNRYSVPPHSIIHGLINDQMKHNECYSVPHTDNSTPQPTTTEDQYSIPRHDELTPRQSGVDECYSVPRTAEDQYSIPRHSMISPHQIEPDEHYSAPRTNNSTPQPITEDQYSIPCRNDLTPHQIKADECYSVPRTADDQYSIPRHSMIDPHQIDEHYSAPRTDNSTPQPITEDQYSIPRTAGDQYSIPRNSLISPHQIEPDEHYSAPRTDNSTQTITKDQYSIPCRNDPTPHQSKADEFYSVPRTAEDQYSVPTHDTTNESLIHQIEPDEHYSAPHTPKPPKVKDRYGPRQRMRSNTNPARFASDDMHVPSNINSKKKTLVRQITIDQSTISDSRITKDDDDYAVPTPCGRKNGVRSNYTYIYTCTYVV